MFHTSFLAAADICKQRTVLYDIVARRRREDGRENLLRCTSALVNHRTFMYWLQ